MTDEQWQAAWKLYQSGSSIPPDQIHSFLKSATDNPEVRETVLAMFERNAPAENLDRIGQKIGRYVLTGRLGEGGMGEVYAARDSELGRSVAVKFLIAPPDGAASSVQRFIHEAKAASALNHPNIVTIYEVIHSTSKLAIAMELVDGMAVRQLCGTPLPVDRLLHLGEQAARALGAAHARGIVHCDIKPENLMVRQDGLVKILDFGLARDLASITSSSIVSAGTLRYMSPEQSRGEAPTAASDVFSLGIVLYELAAGTHPFDRGSVFEALKALNQTEPPPPSSSNAFLPAALDALILRMLSKDPSLRPTAADVAQKLGSGFRSEPALLDPDSKGRLGGIGKTHIALGGTQMDTVTAPPWPAAKRAWLRWFAAGVVLTAACAVAAVAWLGSRPADPIAVRFSVPWPEGATESASPATAQAAPSPDGRYLALIAASQGKNALWVRPLNSPSAHRLDNTEGAGSPFWSPDGKFIAYFADEKLKRIPAAGGAPQTLCDAPRADYAQNGDGGTWSPSGVIVFGLGAGSPLMRVRAAGGPATSATALDASAAETKHGWPQFLPDGRHFLYFAASRDPGKSAVYVQELGSSQRVLVMRSHFRAAWTPPGYLLFLDQGTLFAQRMSLKTLRPSGDAAPVADEVTSNEANGRSSFAVSDNGVLVYRRGALIGNSQPVWYGRTGTRLAAAGKLGEYNGVSLSPDEKSAALIVRSERRYETWIMDVASGALRRATAEASSPSVGPWSPDSERLAINQAHTGGILELTVASGKTRVLSKAGFYAVDWSPDNRSILCNDANYLRLSVLPLDGAAQPRTISEVSYLRTQVRFSPDGRFVAYNSSESGKNQIFLAAFPSLSERRQLSIDGGDWPLWRQDGREIFFRTADGTVMGAEFRSEKGIEAGIPKPLFKCPMNPNTASFSPVRDGKRFLVLESDRQRPAGQLMVAVNWVTELKQP